MGSLYAVASESYSFPHFALFSTELLRTYFRKHRIGVFANSVPDGDSNSTSFENAIHKVGVDPEALRGRADKRLLFYARPEPHASRNMFELGVIGLQEALREGIFQDGWQFDGVGAVTLFQDVDLGGSTKLRLRPRLTLREYVDLLPSYDLGLSLMLTPHPSLVPLEMAAAGMVAVTNTYANKTADELARISSNIIGVPPTIGGVVEGLRRAVKMTRDIDLRLRGSHVQWAGSWTDALNDSVMEAVVGFLRA
jgi:hypothetical protein